MSCDLLIFVEEATKAVVSLDLGDLGWRGGGVVVREQPVPGCGADDDRCFPNPPGGFHRNGLSIGPRWCAVVGAGTHKISFTAARGSFQVSRTSEGPGQRQRTTFGHPQGHGGPSDVSEEPVYCGLAPDWCELSDLREIAVSRLATARVNG